MAGITVEDQDALGILHLTAGNLGGPYVSVNNQHHYYNANNRRVVPTTVTSPTNTTDDSASNSSHSTPTVHWDAQYVAPPTMTVQAEQPNFQSQRGGRMRRIDNGDGTWHWGVRPRHGSGPVMESNPDDDTLADVGGARISYD